MIILTWQMLRNSKISISKPKDASTKSKTRSAIFAMSIMLLMSLLHSISVIRLFLPVKCNLFLLLKFKQSFLFFCSHSNAIIWIFFFNLFLSFYLFYIFFINLSLSNENLIISSIFMKFINKWETYIWENFNDSYKMIISSEDNCSISIT